jgi:hypothetical protein
LKGVDAVGTFNRFAFKALPVCGQNGLWFSAHLIQHDEVFERTWAIYKEAFSGLERRTRRDQMGVMVHPRYRFSAIMHENSVVGVLAWWELPGFCFVEHFAISAEQRSGGFGRRAIALLQSHVNAPILVDVEPFGTDYLAARRVAFYNRLGFSYCPQPVTLPAYRDRSSAPSNFMAWNATLDGHVRERMFDTVCHEVYHQRVCVSHFRAI